MNRPEEVEAKLARVRAWLDARPVDGVLLGSQTGFAWITAGGHNHVALADAVGAASVLVTAERAWVLSDNIEHPRILAEEVAGLPFEPVEWPWPANGSMAGVLSRLCPGARLASDSGVAGLPAADGLAELRRTLLPPEVDRFRALGRDTATALEDTCHQTRPGDSELEVAAVLALTCRRAGILDLVNLVAADVLEEDQVVAWNPSITRVKSEDTVLVTDGGPDVLTRTATWPQEEVTLAAGTISRPALLERYR